MKDQLYLFSGENTFTLSEELLRWQHAFTEKHGDSNFQILEGKDCTWMTLLSEIHAAPFLGEKRLVIMEGIPGKITKEELEMLPDVMHPATILAFVESDPDKRKSTTKFLLKEATTKTFPILSPKQLVSWLKNMAAERGVKLEDSVAAHLVAVVGSDQWHLKNEFLKLLSYVSGAPAMSDVDRVCLSSEKHTVWRMSDLIGKGDVLGAARFARTLHEQGEDAFALWNIYLWITKNLATLWIYQNEKNLPLPALSKESGVPYPSAASLLPCVKKFSRKEMEKIVERAVKADEALKTGELKATVGEPVELITMLERQLLLLKK